MGWVMSVLVVRSVLFVKESILPSPEVRRPFAFEPFIDVRKEGRESWSPVG